MVLVLLGVDPSLNDGCGIWESLHSFRKVKCYLAIDKFWLSGYGFVIFYLFSKYLVFDLFFSGTVRIISCAFKFSFKTNPWQLCYDKINLLTPYFLIYFFSGTVRIISCAFKFSFKTNPWQLCYDKIIIIIWSHVKNC